MARLVAPEAGLNPAQSAPVNLPSYQQIPDVSAHTDFRAAVFAAGAQIAKSVDDYNLRIDNMKGQELSINMKKKQQQYLLDYQNNTAKWTPEEAKAVQDKIYEAHQEAFAEANKLDPRVRNKWVASENAYAAQLQNDFRNITTKKKEKAEIQTLSTSITLFGDEYLKTYNNPELRDINKQELLEANKQLTYLSGGDDNDVKASDLKLLSSLHRVKALDLVNEGNLAGARQMVNKEQFLFEDLSAVKNAISQEEERIKREQERAALKALTEKRIAEEKKAQIQFRLSQGIIGIEEKQYLYKIVAEDVQEKYANLSDEELKNMPNQTTAIEMEYLQLLKSYQADSEIKAKSFQILRKGLYAAIANNPILSDRSISSLGIEKVVEMAAAAEGFTDEQDAMEYMNTLIQTWSSLSDKDKDNLIATVTGKGFSKEAIDERMTYESLTSKQQFDFLRQQSDPGAFLFSIYGYSEASAKLATFELQNGDSKFSYSFKGSMEIAKNHLKLIFPTDSSNNSFALKSSLLKEHLEGLEDLEPVQVQSYYDSFIDEFLKEFSKDITAFYEKHRELNPNDVDKIVASDIARFLADEDKVAAISEIVFNKLDQYYQGT